MNTKQWAVFFVALLSFDYTTATFFFGGYKGVPKTYAKEKEGYYGWSKGCQCNKHLTSKLDEALENVRSGLGKYSKGCPIKDHSLEEYEFKDGHVRGLHKFERKGPYRCNLSRDYVRIIFSIGFFKLLINYSVSIVEDLLTGFLGGIGSLIGKILGNVTNFLFHIALPDVYCTVVLHQRFGVREGFKLEGLYLNNINDITFLNKGFSKHKSSFGPYFKPVCDHVLRNVFEEKLHGVFTTHFSKITAKKEMFFYESESGGKKGSKQSYSYEFDDDDGDNCDSCDD